jgi:hypothetical protein
LGKTPEEESEKTTPVKSYKSFVKPGDFRVERGFIGCMNPSDFSCPRCDVIEGRPCLSDFGVPLKRFHAERSRIAKSVAIKKARLLNNSVALSARILKKGNRLH